MSWKKLLNIQPHLEAPPLLTLKRADDTAEQVKISMASPQRFGKPRR